MTEAKEKKRRNRGHNEGSIRQRPDGVWEARVTCGTDFKTGKPIRKSFYSKDRKTVKEKMDKALTELKLNGSISAPQSYTVGEWLQFWVMNYKLPHVSNNTMQSLLNIIEKYLCIFKNIKLDKLRPAQVQQLYDSIDTSQSTRMVEKTHSCLNDAYNYAIKLGFVNYNPAKATFLPKKKSKTSKALDRNEQQLFLEALRGNEYEDMIIFYLLTGLRRGELVALRWQDIDLDKQVINITGNAVREKDLKTGVSSQIRKPRTKTDAGMRKFPISYEVNVILKKLLTTRSGIGYIFSKSNGLMLPLELPDDIFRTVCEKAGLEDFTLHSLRHTFATRVFESGVKDKVNQALLGHATDSITKQIYIHANDEFINEESKKISILKNTSS